MKGLHIICELHGCNPAQPALHAVEALQYLCESVCRDSGLEMVGACFHQFRDTDENPAGATGAVVLAESHLAIHTWPELGGVTLDLYVCNFSQDNRHKAEHALQNLLAAFAPQHYQRQDLQRGTFGTPSAEGV